MTRWLITIAVLLVAVPMQVCATQIDAWLDRDSVQLGETVQLTVEVQSAGSAQPDFSVLSGDFHLLGTHSSHQLALRDGVRSSKTIWTVELEPRRAGSLSIPVLAFGKARTAPLQLQVRAAAASSAMPDQKQVFLEVQALPRQPWVQQQVQYTVRLFYQELSDGNLEVPQADGALISQVGDDQRYQKTVNGQRYRVLERRYALTPQRSGELTVAALRFHGVVPDAQRRGWFGTVGRQVSTQAAAVVLEVQPRPDSWPADMPWLPARQLQIEDKAELPAQVHVGELVTRTIGMRALGVDFSQLPEIVLSAPDGAQMYADQEQLLADHDSQWLVGERTRKFAFLPDKPGSLRLPGFRVRWWNVTSGRMETASVPGRAVEVLPAAAIAIDEAAAQPSAVAAGMQPPLQETNAAVLRKWQLIAAAATLLWLTTMAASLLRRRADAIPAQVLQTSPPDERPRRRFLLACQRGEWAGAEAALLSWARRERADIRSLGQLLVQLDDDQQRGCIARLQHARYGGGPTEDMGVDLQRALGSGLIWAGGLHDRAAHTPLPPLYPHL